MSGVKIVGALCAFLSIVFGAFLFGPDIFGSPEISLRSLFLASIKATIVCGLIWGVDIVWRNVKQYL